jgi:ABC-type phosphate/phosphonate transport system substrate-binding protein
MTLQARTGGAVAEVATIAALPMYDFPELRPANDALWAAIRLRLEQQGVDAPRTLTRAADLNALWRDPGLLLAQACGYPLVTSLTGGGRLVATPRYHAAGCSGPFHRSAIVVPRHSPARRLADLRGGRCAVNDLASNTGMNLLRAEVAIAAQGRPFFAEVRLTGAHEASLRALACGLADVAAIDAVSFAHLASLRPELAAAVRVLAWSRPSPGLPLVTGLSTPPDVIALLREILDEVARDPALAQVRGALRLDGFNRLQDVHYRAVAHLAQSAVDLGYPTLA